MNEAIKSCSKSRQQIVDDMNSISAVAGISCNGRNQKITLALLDKWVAPSAKSYFIPVRLLPIFCRVVESNIPLKALSSYFADVMVVSKDEFKKLEWAQAEIKARMHRKQASKLAQEVGI
jgi:hypothetical protein